MALCCWDSGTRRFEGTSPSKQLRPLAQQLSFQTHKTQTLTNNIVTPCNLASMLLHDPTCSQPEFQKIKPSEFTTSGLLIRLGSPILYCNCWYQRQSANDEFDFQNMGVHFTKLKKKKTQFKIHRIIVLHGCETWSLTLREERRLRVFENRA